MILPKTGFNFVSCPDPALPVQICSVYYVFTQSQLITIYLHCQGVEMKYERFIIKFKNQKYILNSLIK